MYIAVLNALAIGTTIPVIWITLCVIGLFGPVSIRTINHFIVERSCSQIPSERLMILGVGLLYCVLSIESLIWLGGFTAKLFGIIDNSFHANLYSTVSFILRQWTIICSGILITIAGIRSRDPEAYVGHVGWSVLGLILGGTILDVIAQYM